MAWTTAVVACGPEFPNSYYGAPEREMLRGPEGFFAAEIARLAPRTALAHRAVRAPGGEARRQTLEIDIADVKQALAERGVDRADRVAWHYEHARRGLEAWVERRRSDPRDTSPAPKFALPVQVPAEFRLYLEGAVAWHENRLDDARAAWRGLLQLPESDRPFRGVWATYMLGRLEVEALARVDRFDRAAVAAGYGEARRHLRAARAMVATGQPDALGLAAASLGWEARAALTARDFPAAMRLYLEQHAAGDDSALASLKQAAREALQPGDRDLDALARAPETRRIITAFVVAGGPRVFGGPERAEEDAATWASALERAGVVAVPEADRLAWAAYNAGQFALAERWVALAPAESAEAHWIRAKLALRRGDLAGGERLLRAAEGARTLGEAHRVRVAAELSRVCLAQDDFAGALRAALAGEHWQDAAYVAERVMSLAELKAFVDAVPVAELPAWKERERDWHEADVRWRLRHLLARRLARAGRTEEAESYFPGRWRDAFRAYATEIARGFDATRPAEERGRAFWRAAQRARSDGMDLLGTELDPDWAIWNGAYALLPAKTSRQEGPGAEGGVLAPTPVELQRLEAQRGPEKRFHYRYRAAELAWWAASLLPNDSEETALILHTAGGWLKARDPQAANPFYQALVLRCGGTELGRAAAKARWFPRVTAANEAR